MAERTSVFNTVHSQTSEEKGVYWLNLYFAGCKLSGICLDKLGSVGAKAIKSLIDEGETTADAGCFEIKFVKVKTDEEKAADVNAAKSLFRRKVE